VIMLEINQMTVDYRGGARALTGIDISVRERQIVALVGRNGSGKTTVLRAIAGFLPSELVKTRGSLTLAGKSLMGLDPVRTGKVGVALVLERDKAFANLTVAEHFRVIDTTESAKVDAIAAFPALEPLMTRRAGFLSGGERQMLALAMAISRRPRLLLVDEMSLGLAPIVVRSLMSTLLRLRDELGLTVVLVEQDTSVIVDVADYVYALSNGQIATKGEAAGFDRQAIRAAYFGTGG